MGEQGRDHKTSRRVFLARGLSTLAGSVFLAGVGCRELDTAPSSRRAGAPSIKPGKACAVTPANIEGPFFCENAPSRKVLANAKTPGVPLLIQGRILEPDCWTPIVGATIEIWHADHTGAYDNTCQQPAVDGKRSYKFRAQMKSDAKGRYQLQTIMPGRYLNGRTYRPAHIHYKVEAPGFAPLTTQLYFEGDPYIKGDPFVLSQLIIPLETKGKERQGRFDLVLQKKA